MNGKKPWNKRESDRRDGMLALMPYCIRCYLRPPGGTKRNHDDLHHLIQGNKRMGHWYTIPLCKRCHGDVHERRTYKFADQLRHWFYIQHALGLDDELPASKIVPRRVA